MNKSFVIVTVLALFFLAACSPQAPIAPAPAPEPPAPIVPDQTAPAVDDVTEVKDALDEAFGPRDEEQVITADDVRCDADTSTVTFRFRNLDEKTWDMNQAVGFPAPSGVANVRVTFNSYEVNGLRKPLGPDGAALFGPQEKFSDNCGGVATLAPGEEAVCTISPVPLKAETEISQGANELRINGVGADGEVRFACV